jgi:hypothetical protein
MSSVKTRIQDVLDPEIMSAVASAKWLNKSVLVASGAVVVDKNSEVNEGGQKILIPRWNLAAGTWQAISESSGLETRRLTAEAEYGVVVRRGDAFSILDTAKLVSKQDPNAEASQQIADAVGYHVDSTLIHVLTGAVPSGNVVSAPGAVIDAADLVDLKVKLGDAMDDISLLVVHSKQLGDLMKEGIVDWKAGAEMFPGTGITKLIPTVAGLAVYVTDKVPLGGGSPETYRAFALAKGAMYLGYQRDVNVEFDRDILTKEDIISYDVHFVPHLFGMGWNSTGNPSDANLIDTTKWTMKVENAKHVKASSIITR